MGKRPRITKERIGEVVIDSLQFVANKGSRNARKVLDQSQEFHVEIWLDKHLYNRIQFGSDDGSKREGVDANIVGDLIKDSIGHIFHYSLSIPAFTFLNRDDVVRATRILIQRHTDFGLLNVVVAFFHLGGLKYEATVITAMCIEDFNISDNQYVVMMGENSSELLKMSGRRLTSISSLDL